MPTPQNSEVYVYDGKGRWVSVSPHNTASAYTLPAATAALLGGVKIGSGVNVAADGTISVTPFSGSYNDLTDKPTLALVASTGDYGHLVNRPILAAVANTGSYADLTDEPTKLSDFLNDLGLVDAAGAAAAAPVQSIIAGSNITISNNGGVYTINSTGSATGTVASISAALPLEVVDPTTAPKITIKNATTATPGVVILADATAIAGGTSGAVVDAANLKAVKDSIPTLQASDWNATTGVTRILNKPALSKVATTNAYSDLDGLPTIPTKTSELINDAVFAKLDSSGKLPASIIPAGIDAVQEFASVNAFPNPGQAGIIYLDTTTGYAYRWSGTKYMEIVASPGSTDSITEGTNNLYFTVARARAAAPVQSVAGRTGAIVLATSDIAGLSTVAKTGSYADLIATPPIPAISTALPLVGSALGSAGTSTEVSAADHKHPLPSPADIGAATAAHTHDITTLTNYKAPPGPSDATPVNLSSTASAGVSLLYARGDHSHAMPTCADIGAVQKSGDTMTGSLVIPDGTAAAPSLKFDDATGIFQPAANTFSIATGGNELIRGGLSNVYIYQSGSTERFRFELATATMYLSGATRAGIRLKSLSSAAIDIGVISWWNASDTNIGRLDVWSSSAAADAKGTFRFQTHNGTGTQVQRASIDENGLKVIAGAVATPSLAQLNDADTGFWFPAANQIAASTAGVERIRIDNAGRILMGTSVSRSAGPTVHPTFQLEGTTSGAASFQCVAGSTTAAVAPQIYLARHRGAIGANTVVAANDLLGAVRFAGADGTDLTNQAAHIEATVDGAPANNSIPGRIVFATTPPAGTVPIERMRITSQGLVGIGTDFPTTELEVLGTVTARSVRFEPVAADPVATQQEGEVYYNSTTKKLRLFNGTSWIDLH